MRSGGFAPPPYFLMQKEIQWEGGGMDVVIRLIDPEEELAEFLFQCDEFFEEEECKTIHT